MSHNRNHVVDSTAVVSVDIRIVVLPDCATGDSVCQWLIRDRISIAEQPLYWRVRRNRAR